MTRPEKGFGMIFLNQEDHIFEMYNNLCDKKKFCQDPKDKDKTAVIEKQLTIILKQRLDD